MPLRLISPPASWMARSIFLLEGKLSSTCFIWWLVILGPCWEPSRQKGESTDKPLGGSGGEQDIPLNPQSNMYEYYTYGNRHPDTPHKYITLLLLADAQLAPGAALSKVSQQPLVVAVNYDHTGVIFLIPAQLGNQSSVETSECIPSSPRQRTSDCKSCWQRFVSWRQAKLKWGLPENMHFMGRQ